MKKLAFIGAGTHSDAVFPNINFSTYKFVGYFDDKEMSEYNTFPILGKIDEAVDFLKREVVDFVFITIGDNKVRKIIFDKINSEMPGKIINIISSSSQILNENALVGTGIFIGHHAFIGSSVTIFDNVIINTGAVVEHHCIINSDCNISPNATLNGIVTLGENVYVGSGSIIIQGMDVRSNITLGAGAVVVEDLIKSGLYVGVPAKLKKEW